MGRARARADFVDNFDTGHRLKLGTVLEHRHYDQYHCTGFKTKKIIIIMGGRQRGGSLKVDMITQSFCFPVSQFSLLYLLFHSIFLLGLATMPCHVMM